MPITPSYPGLYIQEAPSNAHTIIAAPTNIAVFIGYTHPLKTPPANFGRAIEVFGFLDYVRFFGGFIRNGAFAQGSDAYAIVAQGGDPTMAFGDMAQAVNDFFLNGGTDAFIVGLQNANLSIVGTTLDIGPLTLKAMELTDSAFPMSVTVRVNQTGSPPLADETADVIITYGPGGPGTTTETYRRLSISPFEPDGRTPNPNYALSRLLSSGLVTAELNSTPVSFINGTKRFANTLPPNTTYSDVFDPADFTAVMQQDTDLDKLPIFNLMSVPGVTNMLVLSTALAFCERKRAFLVMDSLITDAADFSDPVFTMPVQVEALSGQNVPSGINAALYFPYLTSPDPVTGSKLNAVTGHFNEIPPSPTVTGIFAATDLLRGVWKAPAGLQAITNNVTGVAQRGKMTDQRHGVLNLLNIDCLREFSGITSPVVFGARTFETSDEQWRYVSVRRMALFLEQTLLANLKWVVFEPNAEPLWSAITMSINAFMLGLFRQGAFAGTTPSQSFNVQCNSQTTQPSDVDAGKVNIIVAFAPLKPAEFVIITIAQMAGQAQTS